MTRRRFIHKMLKGFWAATTISLLNACCSRTALEAGNAPGLHYVPLNGKSLVDLAGNKLHHGQERFINPFSTLKRRNFGRLLKWKFSKNNHAGLYDREPVTPVHIDWQKIHEDKGLSVTWLKHASLLIKDVDTYILVDPVFSGIGWFYKDFSPMKADLSQMPRPDHLLITHGHYDHLDKPSLARLPKEIHTITPLGYDDIFTELGLKNRTRLDWFERYADKDREIICLPCNHWTMRNPFTGPNTSLWASYLIKSKAGPTLYISGDTGYFDGFSELGQRYSIDLAIFNLGAYEPRWFMAPSHMNPEETFQAFRELNAGKLMVIHWGAFRLGDEPVHFPPVEMRQTLERHQSTASFVDVQQGQTVKYL